MAAWLAVLVCLAAPSGAAGSDADDAPFRSLPQSIAEADEVVVAETVEIPDDGKTWTVRIVEATKGRLCEGQEVVIPNPRLATPEGFVRVEPGSVHVLVLFKGVDDQWRTMGWGDEATFQVREGQVLLPPRYRPGTTLPAQGPPLRIHLEEFTELLRLCYEADEEVCRAGLEEATEAGKPD